MAVRRKRIRKNGLDSGWRERSIVCEKQDYRITVVSSVSKTTCFWVRGRPPLRAEEQLQPVPIPSGTAPSEQDQR